LREAAGAVEAQAAYAATFAEVSATLTVSWDEQREAQRQAKRAKREIEDIVDEGGTAPPDAKQRLGELREAAGAAARRVEGHLDALRRLAARGLPEAAQLLASHPAARPPETGALGGDKGTSGLSGSGGQEESPLEFHFRALVREGVAQPGRGRDDYVDIEALPHARGNVFTARLRGTAERCVLKRFAALGAAGDGVGVFLNELRVLRQLDEHPNVIALEAAVWDRTTGEVFLQFPFVEGGALPQWLAAAPRSWTDRLRLFRGIVQGIAYLHSKKIVHRSVSIFLLLSLSLSHNSTQTIIILPTIKKCFYVFS